MTHQTTVVNVNRGQPCDRYIGRGSRGYPPSEWGNPVRLKWRATLQDRRRCVLDCGSYLATRADLLAKLPDLQGQRLGCHCAPALCHGHLLAWAADNGPHREGIAGVERWLRVHLVRAASDLNVPAPWEPERR